jgi:hypothetical protein
MTRADLIASLVGPIAAGIYARGLTAWSDIPENSCELAVDVADEMIRRGIVKVDDAEPRTGNA